MIAPILCTALAGGVTLGASVRRTRAGAADTLRRQAAVQRYARFYVNRNQSLAARSVAELAPGTGVGIVHGDEYPPLVAQLAQRGIKLERSRADVANLQKHRDGEAQRHLRQRHRSGHQDQVETALRHVLPEVKCQRTLFFPLLNGHPAP